jgi:hypothetical protein
MGLGILNVSSTFQFYATDTGWFMSYSYDWYTVSKPSNRNWDPENDASMNISNTPDRVSRSRVSKTSNCDPSRLLQYYKGKKSAKSKKQQGLNGRMKLLQPSII